MEHVQCNLVTYKTSEVISVRCMVRRTCKDIKDIKTPYS